MCLSEAVSRVLTPLGIRTIMKPTTLKWSLIARAKDNLPAEDTPGAIYALGCIDCLKVYIGETGRTAKQEHKCHTRTHHTELSALARHAHTEGQLHPLEAASNCKRKQYHQAKNQRSPGDKQAEKRESQ